MPERKIKPIKTMKLVTVSQVLTISSLHCGGIGTSQVIKKNGGAVAGVVVMTGFLIR